MTKATRALLVALLLGCGDSTGPGEGGPTLSAVTPSAVPSGSSAWTIVLTGRGFVADSRIRLDGVEHATIFTSAQELRALLVTAELADGRTIDVTVVNPDNTVSNALPLLITNPLPVLSSVTPASLLVGDSTRVLVVRGGAFRHNSVVRWNNVDETTRFVADTELEVDLAGLDVAWGMSVSLSVYNPGPAGGIATVAYLVQNRRPVVSGITPDELPKDAAATTVEVTGENFVPGVQVRLNGSAISTTYYNAHRLTFVVAGANLPTVGALTLSVANPDPAVAPSSDTTFWARPSRTHLIDLLARDLAWDPVRQRLYASVSSTDARYPNAIVAIDPVTGDILDHVNVGFEPHQVAISDDASFLYVTLDGEASVARVDLSSFTRDLVFALGEGVFGTMYAQDIEVLPGHPHTVAVSRVNLEVSPAHEGVALYDDGVQRPLATPRRVGGNLIEFGTPTILFGYNNEDTGWDIFRMDVTDSGLVLRDDRQGLVEQFYADIRAGSGYVYSTEGNVIDAASGWLAANIGVEGLVVPEFDGSRIYYFRHVIMYVVDARTWTVVGSQPMTQFPPSYYSVTRWGNNGFAFIGPTQVVIFRSDLITAPLPPFPSRPLTSLAPAGTFGPTPP